MIKIKFFIIYLLLFAVAFPVWAETSDISPIPVIMEAWEIEWGKTKTLEESGQYLEAQEIYEDMMRDFTIPAERMEEVQKNYQNLKMNILFSRIQTKESIIHTVVSGDTLYDIAKKYQTTVALIKRMNGLEGDTIYPGMRLKIINETFSVSVDKSENILRLYLNDELIKEYSIATGKDNITPVGEFEISTRLENPTWYRAGAIVPPDSPENILGTRWLGFDYPGYGIHGTTIPESIGQQATSGCIRMFNEDVEELYVIIPLGVKVTITD